MGKVLILTVTLGLMYLLTTCGLAMKAPQNTRLALYFIGLKG